MPLSVTTELSNLPKEDVGRGGWGVINVEFWEIFSQLLERKKINKRNPELKGSEI